MDLSIRYPLLVAPDSTADGYLDALKNLANGMEFVYGRGKRKSQLQKDIETLTEYLTGKVKYTSYNETFKGRNSFSKTDSDATFMRMKDDHMKNGQLNINKLHSKKNRELHGVTAHLLNSA